MKLHKLTAVPILLGCSLLAGLSPALAQTKYPIPSSIPQKPLGMMLETYDYPYHVSYFSIYTQQQYVKMAYMDIHPDRPNGETVLLLHGKNFNGAYWEGTIKVLLKAGYRVVAPDQIGFGKSSKPRDVQYSLAWLAANTKKLLDALHIDKTHVVGHSMGGMLAARFSLMYPETTQKLVLENPLGLEDWKVKVPSISIDDWYQGALRANFDSLKEYQNLHYYNYHWKPEYDRWIEVPYRWTLSPDYDKLAYVSALTSDMIYTQPVIYEFEHLQSPTLLLIGDKDITALGKGKASPEVAKTMGNYPQISRQAVARIPNGKLILIPNVGHSPHIQVPDIFYRDLLAFLK